MVYGLGILAEMNMADKTTIAERLRHRREVLGMRQADVARMIACDNSYIARAETRGDEVAERVIHTLNLAYDAAERVRAAHLDWTPAQIAEEVADSAAARTTH